MEKNLPHLVTWKITGLQRRLDQAAGGTAPGGVVEAAEINNWSHILGLN